MLAEGAVQRGKPRLFLAAHRAVSWMSGVCHHLCVSKSTPRAPRAGDQNFQTARAWETGENFRWLGGICFVSPQVSGVSSQGRLRAWIFFSSLLLIVYSNVKLHCRCLLKWPSAARVAVFDRNPRKSPEPQRGNPILFS